MKTLNVLLIGFIIFVISCTKKQEVIPDFEKPYRLSENYDKIGKPGLVYVCHISNDFVSVIDPEINELIGKIPAGKGSSWICFSPDKKTGYITNYNSFNLTVFETKSNKTIATVTAGENPVWILPVQNGKNVLYSHQSQEGIWVLNSADNTNIKKLSDCTGPLYFIEKENKIYQPQIFTPYLKIIDPDKIEVVKQIEIAGRPMEMAFTNNKEYAYMVNFDSSEVAKFYTKSDAIVNKIKNIKNPRGIASSSDNKFLLVTNVVDNTVTVINALTDTVQAVIPGFNMPTSVAFTSDSKFAYVTNQREGTISVIEMQTLKIIKPIKVAGNPIYIMIDS